MDSVSLTSPYSTATETTPLKDSPTFLKCSSLKDKHFSPFLHNFCNLCKRFFFFFFLSTGKTKAFPPHDHYSPTILNWKMYNIKRLKGVSMTDHPLLAGESKQECLSAVRANLKGLQSKLSQLKNISEWLNLAGCCHKWSEQFQIKMQAQQLAEENNGSTVEDDRFPNQNAH